MDTRIRTDRRRAQFLGILILLALCLAMPAAAAEGNKHTGTVLRQPEAKAKTIIIAPPKTSDEISLKAEEKPVTVVNKWYCDVSDDSRGLDSLKKDVEVKFENIRMYGDKDPYGSVSTLSRMAKNFLENKAEDSTNFFTAATDAKYNYASEEETWTANPAQGQTVSKTWKHCYSKPELEAAKKEALRWAHYILDVYLPGLKNKK